MLRISVLGSPESGKSKAWPITMTGAIHLTCVFFLRAPVAYAGAIYSGYQKWSAHLVLHVPMYAWQEYRHAR